MAIAAAVPPMTGTEYLTADVLADLWAQTDAAFAAELAQSKLSAGLLSVIRTSVTVDRAETRTGLARVARPPVRIGQGCNAVSGFATHVPGWVSLERSGRPSVCG